MKVVPGASREGVEWLDAQRSILKVRVTAPPEKGKANKAVLKLLARQLGLPLSALTIVSGSTSQQKMLDISGLDEAILREKIMSLPA